MRLFWEKPHEKKYICDVEDRAKAIKMIYDILDSLYIKIDILVVARDDAGNTIIDINHKNGIFHYVLEE